MKDYDPNINWAIHTVEITYQQWDYTTTATVTVKGNCKGRHILDSAIQMHSDDLYEKYGDDVELILSRPSSDGSEEDTLECCPSDEGANSLDSFLEDMCVGIRIIEVEQFENHEEYKKAMLTRSETE